MLFSGWHSIRVCLGMTKHGHVPGANLACSCKLCGLAHLWWQRSQSCRPGQGSHLERRPAWECATCNNGRGSSAKQANWQHAEIWCMSVLACSELVQLLYFDRNSLSHLQRASNLCSKLAPDVPPAHLLFDDKLVYAVLKIKNSMGVYPPQQRFQLRCKKPAPQQRVYCLQL